MFCIFMIRLLFTRPGQIPASPDDRWLLDSDWLRCSRVFKSQHVNLGQNVVKSVCFRSFLMLTLSLERPDMEGTQNAWRRVLTCTAAVIGQRRWRQCFDWRNNSRLSRDTESMSNSYQPLVSFVFSTWPRQHARDAARASLGFFQTFLNEKFPTRGCCASRKHGSRQTAAWKTTQGK